MFYRLIKEPHVCIQLLFTLPTFYIIFILFPTPYLPRFCLVLCSICIPELEFEPYHIFSQCSQRIVRLRPNIFILSQSDQHPFSVLLKVYKSLFHHVLPLNVQPCHGFEFPHNNISFCALLTSQSTICHCDQLCDKTQ